MTSSNIYCQMALFQPMLSFWTDVVCVNTLNQVFDIWSCLRFSPKWNWDYKWKHDLNQVVHFRISHQETTYNIFRDLTETYCHLLLMSWKKQHAFQTQKSCSQFFLKRQHGSSSLSLNFLNKGMVLSNQASSPK